MFNPKNIFLMKHILAPEVSEISLDTYNNNNNNKDFILTIEKKAFVARR